MHVSPATISPKCGKLSDGNMGPSNGLVMIPDRRLLFWWFWKGAGTTSVHRTASFQTLTFHLVCS